MLAVLHLGKKTLKNVLLVAFAVSMLLLSAQPAAAQSPEVLSELTVFKVVKDAKGKESFEDTASVKPGDVIEYRLKYTNSGKKAIANLQPVLPVPNGTTYLANSASPKLSAVALENGGVMMPFPPVRKIKTAQGKEVTESVPVEEFKSLQWTVAKLNNGASVTLKARMSINKN